VKGSKFQVRFKLGRPRPAGSSCRFKVKVGASARGRQGAWAVAAAGSRCEVRQLWVWSVAGVVFGLGGKKMRHVPGTTCL